MIKIIDIETAVSGVLKCKGFDVFASEVKEGYKRPCCFIEVLPVSVTLENPYSEIVTDSVEITYFPETETKEELLNTAQKFKETFLYKPIKVKDRFLSANEITFDVDKSALVCFFELEFIQETNASSSVKEVMENLNERVVTSGYGTSQNTD